MRIHIQNPADDPLFEFSRPLWDAAVARAPDIGPGHSVIRRQREQADEIRLVAD